MAEPFLLTMMLHQLKVLAFVINEDPNTTIKPKFHFKRGACLWQWPHRPKLPHRQQAMACPQANSLCPFCIISKLYVLQDLAAPHTKPAQQYGSMHISHNGFPSPYWFMLPSRLQLLTKDWNVAHGHGLCHMDMLSHPLPWFRSMSRTSVVDLSFIHYSAYTTVEWDCHHIKGRPIFVLEPKLEILCIKFSKWYTCFQDAGDNKGFSSWHSTVVLVTIHNLASSSITPYNSWFHLFSMACCSRLHKIILIILVS